MGGEIWLCELAREGEIERSRGGSGGWVQNERLGVGGEVGWGKGS